MRNGRDLARGGGVRKDSVTATRPVLAREGEERRRKLRIIMDCSPPVLWYFSTQETALWACSTPTEDQGTFAKSRSPALMLSLGYCMRRRHQILDDVS